MDAPDEKNYRFAFGGVDVCVMDEAINRMVFDLSTVIQLAELNGNNFVSGRAIRARTRRVADGLAVDAAAGAAATVAS